MKNARSNRWPAKASPTAGIARKLAALLLLGAFLFGLNLHLFFLQIFGWSGMLIEYRQESGSWTAAIEKTIEGETPCSVCLQVETALNSDDQRRSESMSSGTDNRILPPLLLPLAKNVSPVEPPAVTHTVPALSIHIPRSPFSDFPTPPPRHSPA